MMNVCYKQFVFNPYDKTKIQLCVRQGARRPVGQGHLAASPLWLHAILNLQILSAGDITEAQLARKCYPII